MILSQPVSHLAFAANVLHTLGERVRRFVPKRVLVGELVVKPEITRASGEKPEALVAFQ
jgi:hypothetical protein